MTGTIARLAEQGFGFISQEGDDKDVFFHSSALSDVAFEDLKVGDTVSFDLEDSEKGPRGVNVTKA